MTAAVDIDISLGTLIQASNLSDKFNIASAGASSREKAAAVLGQAVDFIDAVTPKLIDGWTMEVGSAWDGPDAFLTLAKGQQIGLNKAYSSIVDTALEDVEEFKSMPVTVNDGIAFQLEGIRKVFNLSSDIEAARLAVTAFAHFKDAVWRGNGFSFEKNGSYESFDNKTYKTAKIDI